MNINQDALERYIAEIKKEINDFGTVTLSREKAIDIWYYLVILNRVKSYINMCDEDAAEEYAKDNFSFYDKNETINDYDAIKEAYKEGQTHTKIKKVTLTSQDGKLFLEADGVKISTDDILGWLPNLN